MLNNTLCNISTNGSHLPFNAPNRKSLKKKQIRFLLRVFDFPSIFKTWSHLFPNKLKLKFHEVYISLMRGLLRVYILYAYGTKNIFVKSRSDDFDQSRSNLHRKQFFVNVSTGKIFQIEIFVPLNHHHGRVLCLKIRENQTQKNLWKKLFSKNIDNFKHSFWRRVSIQNFLPLIFSFELFNLKNKTSRSALCYCQCY